MTYPNRGGRIAPDNRPVQAAGIGKNSRRHDLERRDTPFLHGSDLQQGDVQAMEQGQRIAPVQTQQPATGVAAPSERGGGAAAATNDGATIPDPIDFFGERANGELGIPQGRTQVDNSKALTWLPILRQLAAGPGSSPMLANAIINQARALSATRHAPATIIDMNATDDALEAMLDQGLERDDEAE